MRRESPRQESLQPESTRAESPHSQPPASSSPEAGGLEPHVAHDQPHQGDYDYSDGSEMVDEVVSAFLNNQIPTPLGNRSVVFHDVARNSSEPATTAERPQLQQTSRFGMAYRSFPSSVIKRLAIAAAQSAGVTNGKLGKDTLLAISQASDWFFEQVAEDLASYAEHAGRKTIEESDMLALMRR